MQWHLAKCTDKKEERNRHEKERGQEKGGGGEREQKKALVQTASTCSCNRSTEFHKAYWLLLPIKQGEKRVAELWWGLESLANLIKYQIGGLLPALSKPWEHLIGSDFQQRPFWCGASLWKTMTWGNELLESTSWSYLKECDCSLQPHWAPYVIVCLIYSYHFFC